MGQLHIGTHSNCDSLHKNCANPNQTKSYIEGGSQNKVPRLTKKLLAFIVDSRRSVSFITFSKGVAATGRLTMLKKALQPVLFGKHKLNLMGVKEKQNKTINKNRKLSRKVEVYLWGGVHMIKIHCKKSQKLIKYFLNCA